jgi:hypothetical protein
LACLVLLAAGLFGAPARAAGPSASAAVLAITGPFTIRAVHSGKCLDVAGGPGATGNGVRVEQFRCLGAAQTNQHWYLHTAVSGTYYITARHSNRCLDVIGGPGAIGNGARLQQYDCLGSTQTNQRWALYSQDGKASYYIEAAHSHRCLDVAGGVYADRDGTPVQQWDCLGYAQSNQRWRLVPV